MICALLAAAIAFHPADLAQPIMPLPAPPRGFEERTEQLDFSYGWSREVEELAPLRALLEADREAALKTAREDAARAAPTARDRQPYRYFRNWAGQGRAGPLQVFRSLTGAGREEYPPARFGGLIWSTDTNRALTFDEVLGSDWPVRFRDRFCAALTESRRAGGATPEPRPCPDLARTAPIPMDYDDDGRFDTVDVLFEGWFPGDFHRIGIALTEGDVAAGGSAYGAYLEPWSPR